MKKLLSVLLVVTMLLGAIVPSLTVGAAGEALTIVADGAEHVATGTKAFTSAVSFTNNPGDLVYLQLVVWWKTDAAADFTFTFDKTVMNPDTTGITVGPGLGSARALKSYTTPFGVNSADYTAAVVDFETLDAINDAEKALASFQFAFEEAIAADSEFTYGVGIFATADSADSEIAFSDAAVTSAHTFVADEVYEALAEKYKGQLLTCTAADIEFNVDTDTSATLPIYIVNNDKDDSNRKTFIGTVTNVNTGDSYEREFTSGIGLWGFRIVFVYDKNLTFNSVANGFWCDNPEFLRLGARNFNKSDDEAWYKAWGAVKWAFHSFNYDPDSEQAMNEHIAIAAFLPDDPHLEFYGDGLLGTFDISLPETAKAGDKYTIRVMSDLDDDFCNASTWSVPFQTGDGVITVTSNAPTCAHTNVREEITTPASCTAAGLKNIVCEDCNEIVEYDVEIAKLDHIAGDWAQVSAPAIGEAGLEELRCKNCDALLDTREIPALVATTEFALGNVECKTTSPEVKVPLTFSDNSGFWAIQATVTGLELIRIETELEGFGTDNYSCKDGVTTIFYDNATLADITEASGTFATLVFKAPATAGEHNLTLEVKELINAKGEDVAVKATSAVVTASVCEHSYDETITADATIEAEGEASYKCSLCGHTYTISIPKLSAIAVGSVEGKYNETVKVPVSLINNYGIWSVGMKISYNAEALEFVGLSNGLFTVDANSASAKDGVVTVFVDAAEIADITEDGVAFYAEFKVINASVDDYNLTATVIDENTIDSLGNEIALEVVNGSVSVTGCAHVNTETVGAKDATCTEQGYTGDVVCKDCEATVNYGHDTDIDPENHVSCTWQVTKPATADEEGKEEYICDDCNESVDSRPIAKLEFVTKVSASEKISVISMENRVISVTGKNGTDYVKFAIGKNGAVVSATENCEVTHPNHASFSYIIVRKPNTTATFTLRNADGVEITYTVNVVYCTHSNTEWVVTTAPTMDAEGEKSLTCKECGEVLDTAPVDKLVLITKVSAVEKIKSISCEGGVITVYAKPGAEYVKFAIGKNGAKVVGGDGIDVSHANHASFSYITVGEENASVILTDADGNSATYTIKVVFVSAGAQGGGKMINTEVDGTTVTVTAPADAAYAAFRFVLNESGCTYANLDESIETVTSGSITWFRIYNDGTNSVTKTITIVNAGGAETTYTVVANFAG